jgi:hypothetical protein
VVQNIFPFGNQEYLSFTVLRKSENFLLLDFSVKVHSEFSTVLQLMEPAVLN